MGHFHVQGRFQRASGVESGLAVFCVKSDAESRIGSLSFLAGDEIGLLCKNAAQSQSEKAKIGAVICKDKHTCAIRGSTRDRKDVTLVSHSLFFMFNLASQGGQP